MVHRHRWTEIHPVAAGVEHEQHVEQGWHLGLKVVRLEVNRVEVEELIYWTEDVGSVQEYPKVQMDC